jgi:hypothetical protein
VEERPRRLVQAALGLAIAANLAFLLFHRPLLGERRLPLEGAVPVTSECRVTLPLTALLRIPQDARILEDGAPLAAPRSVSSDPTSGERDAYAFSGRTVRFRPTAPAGAEPASHRYELAWVPDYPNAVASLPGLVLLALGAGAATLAWRTGAISLAGVSSRELRLGLAAGIAVTCSLGAIARWNRITIAMDTTGYLARSEQRPPLYPTFVGLCDRTPDAPRERLLPTREALDDPGHRYLAAVRAQKVLTIAALAALVFALSAFVNAWLVAALFFAAYLSDAYHVGGDSSVWFNVESLLSEGLNHPLLFGWLAAAAAYVERSTWPRLLSLALLGGLLLANRAANASLVAIVGAIALLHARDEGWRKGLARSAAFLAVTALSVLLLCLVHAREYGRFKMHASTGGNVICVALQVAELEDVDAFPDPRERAFLRACVVDFGSRRFPDYRLCERGEYVNTNLYLVAAPAFVKAVTLAPGESQTQVQDDLYASVGKKLIARHPRAFAALVLHHVSVITNPLLHVTLALALVLALVAWAKTNERALLFALVFVLFPAVQLLPACLLNYPLERYRSQTYFAEVLALPFVLATLVALRGPAASGKEAPPCAESSA